jgi:hypothetical protein
MNVSESDGIFDLQSMFLPTSSDGYFGPVSLSFFQHKR